MSKAVEGKIQYEKSPVENVSVGYLYDIKVKTDSLGYFFIESKKGTAFKAPPAKTIRSMNIPYVIIKKDGFVVDTIDVRNYRYNKSIFVLDTAKVGVIELKVQK